MSVVNEKFFDIYDAIERGVVRYKDRFFNNGYDANGVNGVLVSNDVTCPRWCKRMLLHVIGTSKYSIIHHPLCPNEPVTNMIALR